MTISAFRALPSADRALALALQLYEDDHCPGCGQRLDEAMDPDLADLWTTAPPVRDHACTALAAAQERDQGEKHHQALRYVVGLAEGWEEVRAESAARRERAAADQQGGDAEGDQ